MKLIANHANGNYLRSELPGPSHEVDWVKAAIAYGSDSETLIENCRQYQRRLDIWMRYDHTVPVSPQLLENLLKSTNQNIFCHLIPDVHHAKTIWWKGYGVYIGSANLTDRAWVTNIEAGMFFSEEELESSGGLQQVADFFEYLESLEAAFPLTKEIIDEQRELDEERRKFMKNFDEAAKTKRRKAYWEGPAFVDKKKSAEKRKRNFLKEWENGLTVLREIASIVEKHRPEWLRPDTPASWQADQFLHAYYYNRVIGSGGHPYEKFYAENRSNPRAALARALGWWESQGTAPSEEDLNLYHRAPVIRELLESERLESLTRDDLIRIIWANHSTKDHVSKLPASMLGLPSGSVAKMHDRVERFADWLNSQRNDRGQRFKELLWFVLYGGRHEELPDRLFEAQFDPSRKISHIGINQLAEMAGWAQPDWYPPRNGRTSKSLRALGYDVKVY